MRKAAFKAISTARSTRRAWRKRCWWAIAWRTNPSMRCTAATSDAPCKLRNPLPIAAAEPVIAEPRLRERHLGVFQGLTGFECERAYPEEYARFKSRDLDHAALGGAESVRQVFERVAGCSPSWRAHTAMAGWW